MRNSTLALCVTGLAGCGTQDPKIGPAPEEYWIVPGVPQAEVVPPKVSIGAPVDPADLHGNAARICETFEQKPAGKVDVLWVVDDSSSMAEEQEKIARGFDAFLVGLLGAAPPPDFRMGLITTDVDRLEPEAGIGPGWLRAPPGTANGERWLACTPTGEGVLRCNVGDGSIDAASASFQSLVRTTGGGSVEKGLLAAMLALGPSSTGGVPEANAGFLRADASLFVIFASDEEDSSCAPYVNFSQDPDTTCLAGQTCKCDATDLTFGSTQYFTRFFEGLKGFGRQADVAIAAIVATSRDVLPFDDGSGWTYLGCSDRPGLACAVDDRSGAQCAFHAPRYIEVAESSGGAVASICEEDFATGLAKLGLAASGLQADFPLTRVPKPESIEVVVVPVETDSCNDAAPCSDPALACVRERCVRRISGGLSEGWQHVVHCADGAVKSSIRFGGQSIPEPLHIVEVCYDVDVGPDPSQCQ